MITQEENYKKDGWINVNLFINEYSSIGKLPSKIEFTEGCKNINLRNLEEIPSEVVFNNNKNVILNMVDKISSDVKFINGGDVKFYGCEFVPSNLNFNNYKDVILHSVKHISENVIFNNKVNVELNPNEKVLFSEGVIFNSEGEVKYEFIKIPFNLNIKNFLN